MHHSSHPATPPQLRRRGAIALRLLLVIALLGGIIFAVSSNHDANAALGFGSGDEAAGRYVYADLADKVLPSVVTVYVKESVKKEMEERNKQLDQLRRLFDQNPGLREMIPFLSPDGTDPFEGDGQSQDQQDLYGLENQYVPMSSGSGIIISSDGYILTNHHVLTQGIEAAQKALKDEATRVTVVLNDGTEISGKDVKVVYSHPLADLALLKIDKAGLTPIKWGDSDKLRVGERVAAIGSPLDLKATVTEGIVCAKNRDIANMSHLIQTDAVINPGSSGGALVNLDGELVGVNRLITSNTGRWQGFGFAIPSNDAKWFADEVMKQGKIEFGYIGVEMAPDGTNKMRMLATLGIEPTRGGVYVSGMPEDPSQSPARAAGLQVGDFIIAADGHPISGNDALLDYVMRKPIGSTMDVTVLRANDTMEPEQKHFSIKLMKRPSESDLSKSLNGDDGSQPTPTPTPQATEPSLLGLHVEPATMDNGQKALRVTRVDSGSPAARAGLQKGDLITHLNRRTVGSVDDLRDAMKARPAHRAHLLQFVRDGRQQLIPLEPEAAADQSADDSQD